MAAAALGVAIVAIVGLLLLYAFSPLLRAIALSLGQALAGLPLGIGSTLTAWAQGEITLTLDAFQWALAALRPLYELLVAVNAELRGLAVDLADFAGTATHQIWVLATLSLPAAEARSRAYTDAAAVTAQAEAEAARSQAETFATAVGAAAWNHADADLTLARDYASGLGVDLHAQVGAALSSAEAYTDGALGRAIDAVRGLEVEALRGIEAGVRTAEGYAELQRETAQAYADTAAGRAASHADDLSRQDRLYSDQQTQLAAVAAAGAIAGVAGAVRALEQSRCLRVCDTLGGLGEAIEAIDLGLVLGFVAEAIRDPHGTEDFLAKEVAPPLQELSRLVRGVLGAPG